MCLRLLEASGALTLALLSLLYFPAHSGDDVTTVVDGIVQWVVPTVQKRGYADVVVVEEGGHHGVGAADQGGRIVRRADSSRRGHPQGAVVPLTSLGSGQQTLGSRSRNAPRNRLEVLLQCRVNS